jgi:site-specific DNA-cytosine methylase
MGWPDDWTRYRADGTEIADSHRFRLCGNGVVAPVAEWIARRVEDRTTADR